MKTNIFIPSKINVGFQNRKDTYTGKLAYIIYFDEKGKLRKETSWQNWRDENIPNEIFDNEPTEGFVLNKKAGGVEESWGWNPRKTYTRVYDPRGFEFEITIPNLLYILENTNSIKGKGLEGKFVYGWDGKDLILMPIESPDYKSISEYNDIVHNNNHIKARDLIVGATYLTKDNDEWVYIGKYDYYSYGYKWLENGEYKTSKKYSDIPKKKDGWGYYSSKIDYEDIDYLYGKYFWFAYKVCDYTYENGERVYKDTYTWVFEQIKSIPKGKFIKCIDEKPHAEYVDIYESMLCTNKFSPIDYSKTKYVKYTFEEFQKYALETKEWYGRTIPKQYNFYAYIKENEGVQYEIHLNKETGLWTVTTRNNYGSDMDDWNKRFRLETKEIPSRYSWIKPETETIFIPIILEELYERLQPCYKETYLENGKLYERSFYYGTEE